MKTPNPTEYSAKCLEFSTTNGPPFPYFLHRETCIGNCDYNCNPIGDEQAASIAALEDYRQRTKGTE